MQVKNIKGFTLVELIVVITIIAILGTIAFISLQGYSASARDSRRISDVNSIKTSLELFQINAGEYPLPDGGLPVTYGTEVLWTQGVIGDRVTKNLSKNLNKKLVDPLLETEYTYSVSNTKKEFQILSLYEKDLVMISSQPSPTGEAVISMTNASLSLTPKIVGTYNELYLKTSVNIIPMPSIITSEPLPLNFLTNTGAIKSQMVTNGENMLNNNQQITTKTGGLDISFELAPLIIKTSSNEDKLEVINKIQSAYSGTKLANSGVYKYILSRTNNTEKLDLVEKTILSNDGKIQLAIINGECGTDNGQDLANTPTNLCSKGTAGSVIDGGVGNTYTWGCASADLGETVSCSANHVSIVNGECGSSSGQSLYETPTTNLCNNGTAGSVTDGGVGNNYSWSCTGTNGGITRSCNALHLAIIDGRCGSDNNGSFTNAPTNLCVTGISSEVVDGGVGNSYTWSCTGTTIYGTNINCSASHPFTTYPGCSANDIVIGIYTISACNVGTNTSGIGSDSYGSFFQFGRNTTSRTTGSEANYRDWLSPGGTSSGSAENWGVTESNKITSTYKNSTDENKIKMQGPCANGYHVPTYLEWKGLLTEGGLLGKKIYIARDALKLPLAGYKHWNTGTVSRTTEYMFYWTSSPSGNNAYNIEHDSSENIKPGGGIRSYGFKIRCFKN